MRSFVEYGLPREREERLKVVQKMAAHTQFCMSGDHTLEATREAIEVSQHLDDVDEAFVFVLSDANLERYGIRPSDLVDSRRTQRSTRTPASSPAPAAQPRKAALPLRRPRFARRLRAATGLPRAADGRRTRRRAMMWCALGCRCSACK